MIPQTFIQELQARADIAEIISSYIPLKRAGRNFRAICPFHGEKTPSFMISPQKQIFHCFGCGEGGGVIQFIMLYEKVNFVEAIEMLAGRLGMEVPRQGGEKERFKTALYDIVEQACVFFQANLNHKANAAVLSYLNKRGINEQMIKQFRLGYAGIGNSLQQYLRERGFSLKLLERAALVVPRGSSFRDIFTDRVIFPIFDIRSRVVGFGARLWKDRVDAPKYINSLENDLYSKRNHLFGLNFSKEHILKQGNAVIVEGYLDMIVPFCAGVKNIAASLGTALTLEQIRLIKRYTSDITLVFDSDKAGQAAALRALDVLLENDLKVKVAKMPSGLDPDSLVRGKGGDYFSRLLDARLDFFDYKIDILSQMYDAGSIEGKGKIASEMFVTIDKLNSEIEKHEYIKKLSRWLSVGEEIVIAEFERNTSNRKYGRKRNKTVSMENVSSRDSAGQLTITEKILIKFMLTNKKAFAIMKRNLKETDFLSSLARKTAAYFFSNYSEEQNLSCPSVLAAITDKEIGRFISQLLIEDVFPLNKEIFKSSMLKLQERRVKELKDKLKIQIKDTESKGDKDKLKILLQEYGKFR